jgi:hypothetical protein
VGARRRWGVPEDEPSPVVAPDDDPLERAARGLPPHAAPGWLLLTAEATRSRVKARGTLPDGDDALPSPSAEAPEAPLPEGVEEREARLRREARAGETARARDAASKERQRRSRLEAEDRRAGKKRS